MYKTGSIKSIVFNSIWLGLSILATISLYAVWNDFWLGVMSSVPMYIFLSLLYDDLKVYRKAKQNKGR